MNKDSNDFIIKKVVEVIEYMKTEKNRPKIIFHFENFYEDYPALVNLIIDDPNNFDFKRLLEMLKVRDKVRSNDISYDDASLYMGERYYDEYVKPKLSGKSEENDKN